MLVDEGRQSLVLSMGANLELEGLDIGWVDEGGVLLLVAVVGCMYWRVVGARGLGLVSRDSIGLWSARSVREGARTRKSCKCWPTLFLHR